MERLKIKMSNQIMLFIGKEYLFFSCKEEGDFFLPIICHPFSFKFNFKQKAEWIIISSHQVKFLLRCRSCEQVVSNLYR